MASSGLNPPDSSITATLKECKFDAAGRGFSIRMQNFENGMFISVSEGPSRIGSIAMSLVPQAGAVPITTTIIPPRDSGSAFFLRMAAEQASSRSGGVAIVSVHARKEMDPALSRELLNKIIEMTTYQNPQGGDKTQ